MGAARESKNDDVPFSGRKGVQPGRTRAERISQFSLELDLNLTFFEPAMPKILDLQLRVAMAPAIVHAIVIGRPEQSSLH